MRTFIKIVTYSLVAFIFLAIIIVVIAPICVVVFEPFLLKDSFDNSHIDSNYSGWKSQTISNFDSIMIPSQWTVSEENDVIYITDNSEVVAIGTVNNENENYKVDEAYMTALCGTIPNSEAITYDWYTGRQTMMGYSNYNIMHIEAGNGETFSYVSAHIKSIARNTTFHMSFVLNDTTDEEAVRSLVEAIVYAHEYTKQTNGKTRIKLTLQ